MLKSIISMSESHEFPTPLDSVQILIKTLNTHNTGILNSYDQTKPQKTARRDAIAFICTELALYQIDLTIHSDIPTDEALRLKKSIAEYTLLLSYAGENNWQGMKEHFQSRARNNFENSSGIGELVIEPENTALLEDSYTVAGERFIRFANSLI